MTTPAEPLILYVRTGCPFCHKVLKAGDELGITFSEKNIAAPGISDELVEKGGQHLVPYLIDTNTGTELYESDDIIAYLRAEYGEGAEGAAPAAPLVCPA